MADEVEQLIELEERLAAAHLNLDLSVIEALLHSDYVIVQPGGRVESKQDVLDSLKTGERRWEFARPDEMEVRIYGNLGIVRGRWRAKGFNGAEPFDYSARFLSTWVKEDDGWRNIAYQAHEIIEE